MLKNRFIKSGSTSKHKKIAPLKSGATNMIIKKLDLEMRERFVRLSHTVCIFFLFESTTFTLCRSYDLVRQFISDGLTITLARVTDEPFHAQ